MGRKTKIGLLDLESCRGCFKRIFGNSLASELSEKFEFVKINSGKEKVDVLFVQGGITNEQNKELLINSSKINSDIVLFGSCANDPAKILGLNNSKSAFEFVDVKKRIVGCPPSENDINKLLNSIVLKKSFELQDYPVCNECIELEVVCLLLSGKKCMGPKTVGGCEIICPKIGKGCNACRTMLDNNSLEENNVLGEK